MDSNSFGGSDAFYVLFLRKFWEFIGPLSSQLHRPWLKSLIFPNMIYNEGSEEDADWWETGKKKKTKESIFNQSHIILHM